MKTLLKCDNTRIQILLLLKQILIVFDQKLVFLTNLDQIVGNLLQQVRQVLTIVCILLRLTLQSFVLFLQIGNLGQQFHNSISVLIK